MVQNAAKLTNKIFYLYILVYNNKKICFHASFHFQLFFSNAFSIGFLFAFVFIVLPSEIALLVFLGAKQSITFIS